MSPARVGDVLVWGTDVEQETVLQAARASRLPFVEKPVALMPDAHVGLGATVGSVIATRGALVPAAVGVDIGCGMIASRTPLHADWLPDDLDRLHSWIAAVVPSGVGKGFDGGDNVAAWDRALRNGFASARYGNAPPWRHDRKLWSTAERQFGTLGSGNHFVEVCLDGEDRVWVVLHSGSRGIGNKLATGHIDGAKKRLRDYFVKLEDPDLAYVVQGTPEFADYVADMLWAQDYAAGNREAMMDAVLTQLRGFVGREFDETLRINCHHNYSALEHHHGRALWVTRKGAIRAREGDLGVVPGSMATGTFITRGLGNPASYHSCSHGAGRRLSRRRAKEELTEKSLEEAMAGKAWNRDTRGLLDEHPLAYKDVNRVMADQADLVEVVFELRQVLNYKGT